MSVNSITLPPLRDRKDEIPILLKHFMTRIAERYARPPLPYSPTLLDACMKYNWPGNVRELENFVKRYLILADEAVVIRELESRNTNGVATANGAKPATRANGGLKGLVRSLKDEAEAITRTLEQTNWNRKEAARLLNISYKALLYKTRQYGIEGPGRQGNRFMGTTA